MLQNMVPLRSYEAILGHLVSPSTQLGPTGGTPRPTDKRCGCARTLMAMDRGPRLGSASAGLSIKLQTVVT
ncbi:hypothetical protein CCHR01_11532 [Colletotrichum chrysophilum]|uniref:Uncharacterized protein n=1 Tax=Colletotrichum chrysophilum TaxID=1836956 RepID=A0AAD9AHU9_9PEZI|nr:hypothetical protein CCHR01_11532 [Colletotrichum chrysophilum]